MWSQNRYVNITLNILLFLLSINFLHYGQFILPIMCLILFIDNRFKFVVNSWAIFIVLCLFGISFFAFSYKLGFYSVMGFCIPMAYYIGSNLKEVDEDNIKKIIYTIAFGMAMHVVLNFGRDLFEYGLSFTISHRHYDIWLNTKIKETLTAINYTVLVGCSYYLAIHEKNKEYRYIGLFLLVLIFIYDIGLGRRTPILLLVLTIIISLTLDLLVLNNKNINTKKMILLVLVVATPIIVFIVLYQFNIFGLKESLKKLMIVSMFTWKGLNSERLELFINALKLVPSYLWGGQAISGSVGIYIHDLWMDTYDYAGVIPYALITVYTINSIIELIKALLNKNISKDFKMFSIPLVVTIFIQLHLDPIMTGSSIFLICSILILTIIEKLNYGK